MAQKEAEKLKGDYDTKIMILKHNESDLQSELSSLKRDVADSKQRLSPGISDFRQWILHSSISADTLIPEPDIGISSDTYHIFAHNALLNVCLENWSTAFEHAEKSIATRPSAMGYIAKALALAGSGELEGAMQAFDLALGNHNPNESNLLLLVKAVILFVSRKYDAAISRVRDLIAISKDDEATYCYIQVLVKMYLMQGDFARAVQTLKRGQDLPSSCAGHDLKSISLIFGWTFDDLQVMVQRCHCESLYASGRIEETAEVLLEVLHTFDEKTEDWVIDLKGKCVDALEKLGDAALSSGVHDDAIAQYTSALSLNPSHPINILVKRSKARASKELWEDALTDANEVIELDRSSYLGYERKYAALHGASNYDEAYNALFHMLSIIENSPDKEICRNYTGLRENYTASHETIAAIDTAIQEIFRICPLVLIDVTTGRLCNAEERILIFKSETSFKKLVSDTGMTKIDLGHIRQSVAGYFKWTMFSHTWEGKEPTFQDVNIVGSVWQLDESPPNEKLRQFCAMARDGGGRWVWSDTCCIDKTTSAITSQSLTSMYSWYAEAEEILVYLADVLSSAELGALTRCRWMTRAWALQELLASRVIRFYTREWKLYLNDQHTNHKESPEIKQELARAIGVSSETITSFQPEQLGVREKLCLASTRNATVEEDIAYSLIGIFSSDIIPRYGLGKTAIGHLLENVVARTGDVTVIAWTGKPSPYNSALPDSLAVYSQVPHSPPPIDVRGLDILVERLHTQLAPHDAMGLCYWVTQLRRATFLNRCLQLPCIVFSVTKISIQEFGGSQGALYRATVSLLSKVEFRTGDVISLKKPRKLVFVHPWIHDLRDALDGAVLDDERQVQSNVGSSDSDELEAGSNAGSGDGTDDASASASPSDAEPSPVVDPFTRALQLIARLTHPFNALLLEQQSNGQYKRVAAEHEIIIPGVPLQTNPKDIRVKVLEIV